MADPIDEVFKKYEVEPMRFYPAKKLYEIMYELGLVRMNRDSFTRNWIERKVKKGRLILPEKELTAHWWLTGKQIREIVYAFAPGGKQRYDFKKHESKRKRRGKLSTH